MSNIRTYQSAVFSPGLTYLKTAQHTAATPSGKPSQKHTMLIVAKEMPLRAAEPQPLRPSELSPTSRHDEPLSHDIHDLNTSIH